MDGEQIEIYSVDHNIEQAIMCRRKWWFLDLRVLEIPGKISQQQLLKGAET